MHIHFIGIGGIGVSAVAQIALQQGTTVSGSDMQESVLLDKLRSLGCVVTVGHDAKNIPPQTTKVVASPAVFDYNPNNPELVRAKELGIPILSYPEFLGACMVGKQGIAIAGTHGKTTTTSLLAWIFTEAQKDPTFVIGGEVNQLGGNAHAGTGEQCIAEACEYEASFLHMHFETAVITNIDADHLDYYKTFANVLSAFEKFVAKLPVDGTLVACKDDKGVQQLLASGNTITNVITYGITEPANWQAQDLRFSATETNFTVVYNNEALGNVTLTLPGTHMILNALAALAVATLYEIPFTTIQSAVHSFKGTRKRMELLGEKNGIAVYDDYGHHPTEIRAALNGFRQKFPDKKILVVFQPHLYSRTKLLLNDFAQAFSDADQVLVTHIYFARERQEDFGITSKDLVDAINNAEGKELALHTDSFEDAEKKLTDLCDAETVVLTLGAGNAWKVGRMFLS